jgi:hypothetical protein
LEKTSQFQDQKQKLEESHQLQITEATTKLQESQTDNSNLKSLLSQKKKENDQLNQNLNAEGLKFKSLIEELQRELKTSQETQRKQREQNLNEKKMLKTNHNEGLRSLKNQFENEKKKLLQNYDRQINEETKKHQQTLKEKLKLANDNEKKQHEKILKEKVQMMTNQFQENTTKLVQDNEKQIETLKVNANKCQEENKSLKQERDYFQFEFESLRDPHNKIITSLKEQFLKEKEYLERKHGKDLTDNFEALTLEFQDQKLNLEQENQNQMNEKSKQIKDRKEEISNLRSELARRSDKIDEMKHQFETERLQFQNDSEKFKNEIEKLKVEITAQNNQTEQLKQEFEAKKNTFSIEIKELISGATEYQTSIRTLEEKLSASKDENNSSNERISKLSDDLQAAKQQLEPFLTQEKIHQKMINDQNALALAVEEGNQEKVSAILKNSEMNINSEMKFEAKKIEGSILVLAILNEDLEMIKMLVQDFGADVNQKIAWSQNQSNIFILAMAKCYKR